MIITIEFAKIFAEEWINSRNSHDIDKILNHYSHDFMIETPMAAKLFPESNGKVLGKADVRKYWQIGLERIPNLKFVILDILIGINGLTIYYINTATNKKSVEIMNFNEEQKVNKAIVHYSE